MNYPRVQERNVALDLLEHYRKRHEVVIVLERRAAGTTSKPGAPADRQRIRGYVVHVAPSFAFALLWDGEAEAHIPLALVLGVHRPHFLEPLDGKAVSAPPARQTIAVMAGQMMLWGWDFA
jgi:hypothetical protein